MLSVAGYYDGSNVQFLEEPKLKRNQRVIVTIMDEFVDTSQNPLWIGEAAERQKSQTAYEKLLSYRKPGIGSGDYKKDLAEMLEKKYETVD